MKYKKLRLNVYPASDLTMTSFKKFEFDTASELIAAKNLIADMLLYLQDEIKVMQDYSNMFVIEVLPMLENSEWEDCDEDDLEI